MLIWLVPILRFVQLCAIETSKNSDNLTSFSVPFGCAHDSPTQCGLKPGVHQEVPDLGYVVSFGEDNKKDVYLLTSSGVYGIAAPSRCGYPCFKEAYSNLSTRVSSSGTLLLKAGEI